MLIYKSIITWIRVILKKYMIKIRKGNDLEYVLYSCGRRLKNEADCCLNQYLNCNVVLIEGPFHKILRSVNFPLNMNIDQEQIPTMADMLGTSPAYKQVNNTSLVTRSDLIPSSFNTQNSSFFSSSSSTTIEYFSEKTLSPVAKSKPPRQKQYLKSQQLNQIPEFEVKVRRRSVSGPLEVRRDGNENHSRVKNGEVPNLLIRS